LLFHPKVRVLTTSEGVKFKIVMGEGGAMFPDPLTGILCTLTMPTFLPPNQT